MVGSKAKVVCNLGYGIKTGSSKIICNETGDWADMPACVPVCPAPQDAEFAHVYPIITSAFEGTRVNYTCDETYETAGQEDMTATCQANSSWSTLLFQCQIACETPDSIANASLFDGEKVVNAKFTYSCDPGCITTDGTDNFTRTCLQNRSWTEPSAYCLKDCGEPGDLGNATLQSGKTYDTTNRTYNCNSGYISTNNTKEITVTCRSGTWTNPDFVCLKECMSSQLYSSQHYAKGLYIKAGQPTFDGSVVKLACRQTLVLEYNGSRVSDHTVTCNNGTWEDVGLAQCVYECPQSKASYEEVGRQRLLICLQKLTQPDARRACSRFGSLVKIDTKEKKSNITQHIQENVNIGNDERKFWIQGEKINDNWKYDNMSVITFPDNGYFGNLEISAFKCMSIKAKKFTRINCDKDDYFYICEMH